MESTEKRIHEAIQTKSYEEVRQATAQLSPEELKKALRLKYNGETAIQLVFKLGLFEIAILLLQRALSPNSKYASLVTIDIFDAKNRAKYYRILFDLLDALLTRGSQRVKAKELAKELDPIKSYLSTMPIDLCLFVDKPKYIVTALLLGADPGPKSEHSWLSQMMGSHNLQALFKQQLLRRLIELNLLTQNVMSVKIWSKLCIDCMLNTLSDQDILKLRLEPLEVDEETGNNALHYALQMRNLRQFGSIYYTLKRLLKYQNLKDPKVSFLDMLLQKNKNGVTPLQLILKQPEYWNCVTSECLSSAIREIALKKDVENLHRVFASFIYNRGKKSYIPTLSFNKSLLLLIHQCGIRYEFLKQNYIPDSEIMLEIEQLYISNLKNNDTKKEFMNESNFDFENLPSEIAYHIASYMQPLDVVSLFMITKRTTKLLLLSNKQEKFWQIINDKYFAPNQNEWIGSHKTRAIKAWRASHNWQNQKFKVITDSRLTNLLPLLMDENCLVMKKPNSAEYASNLFIWDCHSQKLEELDLSPQRFIPVTILKQNNAVRNIPVILGRLTTDNRAAIFRDNQFHMLNNLFRLQECKGIDENRILLTNGQLYDMNTESFTNLVQQPAHYRVKFGYNPFNRSVITVNIDTGNENGKLVMLDLNGKKIAEYDRYVGNYLFYPIDEYTMLYNTMGPQTHNALGHIDLRTGKDIVRIDGLLYTSRTQKRVITSERLLFCDNQTKLQTSWNFRACGWEYVEETTEPCYFANTRYSVHCGYQKMEIRDYCSKK